MKHLNRTFRRSLLAFALVSAAVSPAAFAEEQIAQSSALPRVEQTTATFLNALAQGGGTLASLQAQCAARAPLFSPQAERAALLAVLAEAGLTAEQIALLRSKGVIQ